MPELLTAERLANALRVSPSMVKLWSRSGKTPTVWLSKNVHRSILAARNKKGSSQLPPHINNFIKRKGKIMFELYLITMLLFKVTAFTAQVIAIYKFFTS
ncbi:MAG TPA: hypothetical protein DCY03_05110 [Planctomycetaceae bacterium]|nr:hypothetical protein [Planctomycetaceae bacterium]|tara:strand:+ start:6861 stop:7160 length:300 start_codon:yes stop_codon:yes gene_type:complete